MAKSMRSKKEKRLRAIRREMVGPLYDAKDTAKLTAQAAALAAPKLPVRNSNSNPTTISMDSSSTSMDVEMTENQNSGHLKPAGGVGKKMKKKLKLAKGKRRGKQKIRKTHI